ncbi:MAG: zinc ribbon domain-containing protein [Bacillota bacterium]|nr:zinc ribbon domain-containing protein [Bacillota bacterium]
MSGFKSFTKKVSHTAKAAAKKSSDIVEVTKLNMNIGSEEDKIQKKYTEIGKILYDLYVSGESTNEVIKTHCEVIKTHEENIKKMKQKILELKNIKVCPSCGTELEQEILFCSKCGAKQEVPETQAQAEETEKAENNCPECGTAFVDGALFCGKCGAKLQ